MNWQLAGILSLGCALSACQAPTVTNTAAETTSPANSAATAAKKAPPTDLQALAARLVNQSAAVKEGEVVLINGGVRDLELLENIAVEVLKAGAQPLLTINTERITKRSYTDVPAKYDTQPDKVGMALGKTANVQISVESGETEGLLSDVPPERLAARAKAGQPTIDEFRKNKVRFVNVGNALYPTDWNAKRYEIPLDAFTKLFWESVNIDYSGLQATGEKARAALAGKEVEITHPNGTNLKVSIENKPAYISDGAISADDLAKGNTDVYLPAGEAAVVTSANSGTGKFVVERDYFQGKEIRNLVYTFENGKLTSITGEGEGFAAFKKNYDAGGEGKDVLSYVDIGINENFKLAPTTKYASWVSAGAVTIGTGDNTWAGGTNRSSFGTAARLGGATVKIDGRTIVENGVLKF